MAKHEVRSGSDQGPAATPTPTAKARRPDASMLLLNEIMHKTVDPGYEESAARRRGGYERPRSMVTTARVTVLAVALGFAAAAAAMELRAPQPEIIAARAVLEQEIQDRRAVVEDLKETVDNLNSEIEQIQTQALSERYPKLLADLVRDSAASGALAVEGPGLVVTMRDAAQIGGDAPVDPNSRVQDYDIQVVANSLWAAGAEAISINGQRLTARSAIRSAGDAILVDLVGLIGPYEIQAVGNPEVLGTYFTRSLGQQHLSILSSRYGISSSVDRRDEMRLRAGQGMRLFYASVPEDLELQHMSADMAAAAKGNTK